MTTTITFETDFADNVSNRVLDGLTLQTPEIREAARCQERISRSEYVMRPGVLQSRLAVLQNARLFLDRSRAEDVGIRTVLLVSAVIARQVHGLGLLKAGQDESANTRRDAARWVGVAMANDPAAMRGHTYLNRVLRPSMAVEMAGTEIDDHERAQILDEDRKNAVSIERVDLTLFAHSFGLPLWALTLRDDALFKRLVHDEACRRTYPGRLPLLLEMEPLDILDELAEETDAINLFDTMEAAAEAGIMIAVDEADRKHEAKHPAKHEGIIVDLSGTNLVAGRSVWAAAHLPKRLGVTECLFLLVDDNLQTTLLSVPRLTGGYIEHPSGGFDFPQVLDPSFTLPQARNGRFLLVAASRYPAGPEPDDALRLGRSIAYVGRTGSAESDPLVEAELRDLIARLLARPAEDWNILSRRIAIVAPQAGN